MKKILLVAALLVSTPIFAGEPQKRSPYAKVLAGLRATPGALWDATGGRALQVARTTWALVNTACTTGSVQIPEITARQAGKDLTVGGIFLLVFSLFR